ncbi:NlpC-P60 family protein, partial [Lysobacter sp. D1-1-M9]
RSTLSILLTIPVLAAGIALGPVAAREPVQPGAIPEHGVVGVQEGQLGPGYWLARLRTPDRVLMDKASIRKQNTALLQLDDSMYDLRALPTTLPAEMVRGWIESLSKTPEGERWDVDG